MIRAFIAVTLGELIIEEIAKVHRLLQEAKGDIRWTRVDSLHLTLKFLGDIEHKQVEPILRVLNKLVGTRPPLHLIAQGLGVFPNLKRPRVLWVGLKGEGLIKLVEAIETALMRLDFPPDDREFTPHLTLGRIRSPRGWDRVFALMKEHENVLFGESTIEKVTLYQSTLRPDGAIYTVLGSIPFQQA
ncbi:MAG: RNA 2',3'-cyclic phosphodiesterase [Candidatus Binatia bacterium]